MLKLTRQQLSDCYSFYSSDSSLRSQRRFGEYVWNRLAPAGAKIWIALYYEADNGKAYDMLHKEAS